MNGRTPDESQQLSWLQEAWRQQAIKIDNLTKRWADLHDQKNSPETANKLARMLDQIALFKDKEKTIVSEIEAMEEKHRYMRQNKMLKKAGAQPTPQAKPQEPPQPKSNLLEAAAWIALFKSLCGKSPSGPKGE